MRGARHVASLPLRENKTKRNDGGWGDGGQSSVQKGIDQYYVEWATLYVAEVEDGVTSTKRLRYLPPNAAPLHASHSSSLVDHAFFLKDRM